MDLDDKVTGLFNRATGSNPNARVRDVLGAASYQLGVHDTGRTWFDGKRIFRKIVLFAGGNGSSASGADPEIASAARDTLISVSLLPGQIKPSKKFLLSAHEPVIDVDGAFDISHGGTDLSDANVCVIVEFTKSDA